MSDIALFKGAGILAGDLAKYKNNIRRAQASAPQVGGLPILKLGKDGVWRYGQNDDEVQEGSEWAINPVTFKKGFIAWAKGGGTKPLGKVLSPVLAGNLPVREDLPDVGEEWTENVYFELTCLNGDDKDKVVAYASNAMGGVEAFHVLLAHLEHQMEVDQSKLVPIVSLTSNGYQHSNRSYGIKGWIEKPVFEILEWVSNGQAPEEVGDEEAPAEAQPEPKARAAAPARGAAPTTRTAAPARAAAAANGRSAAPSRRAAAAKPEAAAEEAGEPAAETVEPVVRRRRRAAVTDVE